MVERRDPAIRLLYGKGLSGGTEMKGLRDPSFNKELESPVNAVEVGGWLPVSILLLA